VVEDNAFPIQSILAALPQLRALIALVVDSRQWNQSFGHVRTAHDARFPSNSTKHRALLYVVSIRAFQPFVQLHPTWTTIFFAHYCRT